MIIKTAEEYYNTYGMPRTRDTTIEEVTKAFVDELDPDAGDEPPQIKDALVNAVNTQIRQDNIFLTSTLHQKAYREIEHLEPSQIGDIILRMKTIARIKAEGDNADVSLDRLAVYHPYGEYAGTYVTGNEEIKRMAKEFFYEINRDQKDEVVNHVYEKAERKERSTAPNRIAVKNGIYDYNTKILEPFDEKEVFLTKIPVAYNPSAKNVFIQNQDGTYWDVESWFNSLSDDDGIVNLFWEITSALVRPFVRFNKGIFLMSRKGCNGKGTLLELWRGLLGNVAASVSIASLSTRFGAAALYSKTAILSDENAVGAYIEDTSVLKAVLTNDVIQLEKKHKDPFSYRFWGTSVFCVNDIVRFKEKGSSLYRRIITVPFEGTFFENGENTAIKDDYVHRGEVLEYVLKKALEMNCTEFHESDSCKEMLDEFKLNNDTVRQFAEEVLPEFSWDFIPFDLAYKVYEAYTKRYNPSASPIGRNKFIDELIELLQSKDYGWECPDKRKQVRVDRLIYGPEMLIDEYYIVNWMSDYNGADRSKRCSPHLKLKYRGIQRKSIAKRIAELEALGYMDPDADN